MPTPTDDRPELLTVIAHAKAAPGKEDDLRTALQALVAPTVREQGCINYDMHESVDPPGLFYFYENWESPEAHDAHIQAPHLQRFVGVMDDLLDGGLTLTRLRRVA